MGQPGWSSEDRGQTDVVCRGGREEGNPSQVWTKNGGEGNTLRQPVTPSNRKEQIKEAYIETITKSSA